MALPTGNISTDHLDAETDSPHEARETFRQLIEQMNVLMDHIGSGEGFFIGELRTFGFSSDSVFPPGWVECNGAPLSRTVYKDLFAKIGTTYGSGDGRTTFQVPDFRRRIVVGRGGTGTSELGSAVGSTGGEMYVKLTTAQMPSHNHTVTLHTAGRHRHSAGTLGLAEAGDHTHEIASRVPLAGHLGTGPGEYSIGSRSSLNVNTLAQTVSDGEHTHTISGRVADNGEHRHTVVMGSDGSQWGIINCQPCLVVLWLIYTGV